MQTFCESGYTSAALQRHVDNMHPDFQCEEHRCSPFSPGPVKDEEPVAFFLVNPTHFDEVTGVLVPMAFQEVTNRDLSLLRIEHSRPEDIDGTITEIIERGMERVPPILRKVEFASVVTASKVREIVADGTRMFGIYDTGLERRPGHASVFAKSAIHDSKKSRAKARAELHKTFAPHMAPVAEIRDLTSR